MQDNEQCEYFGTIPEIAEYLGLNAQSLKTHLSRKRKGKAKHIKRIYDLIEIKE